MAGYDWDSTKTYAVNDLASDGGSPYISLQNGNLNHQPSLTTGTWWAPAIAASKLEAYGVLLPELQASKLVGYSVMLPELQCSKLGAYAVLLSGNNRPRVFRASSP